MGKENVLPVLLLSFLSFPSDTVGSVTALQLHCPWFNPEIGLLSVQSFACSSIVSVGFSFYLSLFSLVGYFGFLSLYTKCTC